MRFLALLVCAGLTACVAAPNGPGGTPLIVGDQFSPSLKVTGIEQFDNPFGGTSRTWFLRSFINKESGSVTHQLYVELGYQGDWRFYDGASTDEAKPLEVTVIDRQVENCSAGGFITLCSFREIVGIDIPAELLARRSKSGFQIKLISHSGDARLLDVTSEMAEKQLAAIDGARVPTPGK